jgi:hypothetical protein
MQGIRILQDFYIHITPYAEIKKLLVENNYLITKVKKELQQ